jgi:transposase
MVSAVRRGECVSAVARRFRVARSTVRLWVGRAQEKRLDRVDFADERSGPRRPANKTSRSIEDLVLSIRRELREDSALGEWGAAAIHRELKKRRARPLPSVRTIGRILERRGTLDGRRRVRRPAPPPGWHLPEVAGGRAELDSFDIIEGLVIQGGLNVEVLNGISLHGGLAESWPRAAIRAKTVVTALIHHWRRFGVPDYAQFDNDTVFQGPHAHADTVGRVTRLCLSLDVIPVFAPPRETGFQAAIENFNGRWQAAVWNRFHFDSRQILLSQSGRFITAHRRRRTTRIDAAPTRREFPADWELDLQTLPDGQIIYLRRTDDSGRASLLGHTFDVDRNWPHRLVRAELNLATDRIRFYALRRRTPEAQPLLKEISHHIPRRKFHE